MRFDEFISSKILASYMETLPANEFMGKTLFPEQKTAGLDIKWMKTYKGQNAVLAPSNFDAIPTIRGREGFEILNTELAFFRESMTVKEQDMMNIQRAQSAQDPFFNDALASIFDDASKLVDAAELAKEKMRMQLIATDAGTPKISIRGKDNMIYTYNYDPDGSYKASHYTKLLSSATWNNYSTSKPLDDIRTAVKKLKVKGVSPKAMIMSSKTLGYLVDSEQIKNVAVSASGQPLIFMDDDMAKDIIRRKTGLTVLVNDDTYIDYDGTQKQFYPDDKVTIIGDGALGKTYMGMTPEERTLMGDPTVDVSIVGTGTALAVQTKYGPPTQIVTSVSQLVVPSYEGISKTYVIDVK